MTNFLSHLRYSVRHLRKTPGFTIVCVLTLALGRGANTAVFSVMNAVLLKSLPVADPQKLVYLFHTGFPDQANNTGDSNTSFSFPTYNTLRRNHPGFSDVIAYVPMSFDGNVAVRFGTNPDTAEGDMVSGNFFSGLGVRPARGRGFTAQDENQHAPVAVISYGYWTRRFSRDPDVIGKTLFIKSAPFTIVGITPEGFEGTEAGKSTDFWIPMQSRPEFNAWGVPPINGKIYLDHPNWWCLHLIARIAPGVSKSRALEQIQPLFQSAAYIGIGTPKNLVFGVYYLPGSSQFVEAAKFKGFYVIGANGTFNVNKIMAHEQSSMQSHQSVNPGPHGGKMLCGIVKSTTTGRLGSACVWATPTEWAIVEYLQADQLAQYGNMAATAVKLKDGMEVPAAR